MKISQTERLYNLLSDGEPHSTVEILNRIYGVDHAGYANIHGRITDIRKKYHLNIINFKDDNTKTLTYYQIIPKEPEIRLEDTPEYRKYGYGEKPLQQIRLV
jgi:hypothetical protein